MQTQILKPDINTFQQAKNLIDAGELVAFPTETIYGLGANALDTEAVQKIFLAKGRPSDNPLIVHIGNPDQIAELAEISHPLEQQIIEKFFPGPLTLLLKKKEVIPEIVSNNPYVGIRMPAHQVALAFLNTVQVPIAAPSANISGKPSPTSAEMVADHMAGKIWLIIDGGNSDYGIESTVLKVDPDLVSGQVIINILRPGFISKEDLETAFPDSNIIVQYSQKEQNLSPGMRFKHYRIDAEIQIIQQAEEIALEAGIPTAIIASKEWIEQQEIRARFAQKNTQISPKLLILERGTENNLASCAHNLFALYHHCQQQGIKKLYIQQLPEQGLGFAIMNRVKRSAEKGNSQ